jgi:hypothetical protein
MRIAATRLGGCAAAAFVALHLSAAACAGSTGAVAEYVDERTGANITVVGRALTFALERSTLAANARDYVSLTAVEVDRSGEAQIYLVGFFWSTIDRRRGTSPLRASDRIIEIFADGRRVRLRPDVSIPKDLAASPLLLAPATSLVDEAAYPVSLDLLRYIAESRVLTLHIAGKAPEDDQDSESYELWTDARHELMAFTRSISPAR